MPRRDRETARILSRYTLHDRIASGGMARVHLGRLDGPVGFGRTVAIKCLHAHYAEDPEFLTMFLDEARLAARIQHPNVVQTLDVIDTAGELFLVMEYVHGDTLSHLRRSAQERGEPVPPSIATGIVAAALHGLHAAHEAKSEAGTALGIIHRDVSPQNIMVGLDGVARVLDFGVAKAAERMQTTREGRVKGKIAYMSPEQLTGGEVDRRTDVFAASIVLWETLVGRMLFYADNEGHVVERVLTSFVEAPSHRAPGISPELDAIVLRGLDREPSRRFATAREMALALERTVSPARPSEIGEWVERIAGGELTTRSARIAEIESGTAHVRQSKEEEFLEKMGAGRVDPVTVPSSTATTASSTQPQPEPQTQPQLSARSAAATRVEGARAPAPPSERHVEPAAVSSTTPDAAIARKPSRRVWVAWTAGLAALAALAAGSGSLLAHQGRALGPMPTTASAPPAQIPAASAGSPSEVPPAATSSAPPQVDTASPPATTAPTPAVASAAHSTSRPASHAPPRPPSSDCSPPYVYDAMGHKVYKRNCPLE